MDEMGTLISPHYLTSAFPKLLDKNGLRHIRFHDLRHSCASLLLANDVPMKQIQEWLGHSDISTTANIYSHLDYKSKLTFVNVMDNILSLPDTAQAGWRTGVLAENLVHQCAIEKRKAQSYGRKALI